jgi:hypothetical protein
VLDHVQIIPEQLNSLDVQLDLGQVETTRNRVRNDLGPGHGDSHGERHDHQQSDPAHAVVQSRCVSVGATGARGFWRCLAERERRLLHPAGGTGDQRLEQPICRHFSDRERPADPECWQQELANRITIDGISTVSAVWGGASVITPSEDGVQDMKMVSNGYDAENGRFSGAQIQVRSKRGTNDLHGSAFFKASRRG